MKACFDAILDLQSGLADIDFTQVENIVLLFGASTTLPRVIFEIRFSPALLNSSAAVEAGSVVSLESDKENINETAAVQHFFHNFIQCDLCGALTLPATKMFLFIKAPRCSDQKWLVPKLHFSISKSAKVHKRLTITSNWLTPDCPSVLRKPSSEDCSAEKPTTDCVNAIENDSSNVWYSAPMSIPGYAF